MENYVLEHENNNVQVSQCHVDIARVLLRVKEISQHIGQQKCHFGSNACFEARGGKDGRGKVDFDIVGLSEW